MMTRIGLFSLFFMCAPVLHGVGMFSWGSLFKEDKAFGVSFLKERDALRRREHGRRQQELLDLQSYKQGLDGVIAGIREKNKARVPELRAAQKNAPSSHIQEIHNTAIQYALLVPEAYDEIKRLCKEQEQFLTKFIHMLEKGVAGEASGEGRRAHCSWNDFRAVLRDLEEQKEKRISFQEAIILTERNIARRQESFQKTHERYKQEISDARDKEATASLDDVIRHQYIVMIEALRMRSQVYEEAEKVALEKMKRELSLKKDRLSLQSYVINELQEDLPRLKARMLVSPRDKAEAEVAVRKQASLAAMESDRLDAELRMYLQEKQRIKQAFIGFAEKDDVDDEEKAQKKILEQERLLNEQRIAIIAGKKELLQNDLAYKKNQLAVIEAMFVRSQRAKEQSIDVWIQSFHKEKEKLEGSLEAFADYAQNIKLTNSEIAKALDVAQKERDTNGSYRIKKALHEVVLLILQRKKAEQDLADLNSAHTKHARTMLSDITFVLNELEKDKRSLNIWLRSDKAISASDLHASINHFSRFASHFASRTLYALHPLSWQKGLVGLSVFDYLFFLLYLFLLLFFMAGFRWSLGLLGRYLDRLLYIYQGSSGAIYLTIARSFARFFERHGRGISIWLLVRLYFLFESSASLVTFWYLKSAFYIISIPFFLYISRELMSEIKQINQRMSFLFFTEKLQEKFLLLIMSFLFSSALLLPLRRAVWHYCMTIDNLYYSPLPDVIYGAWTLVLSVLVLFLFSKEDVLRLIPSGYRIGAWLQDVINQYYYPVFIFVMGLFILVNPYVGFSNFAVYLAICAPLTMLILYAMVTVHTIIRKMSFYFFMKDSDDDEEGEVQDRFDHAKMYYGFFIIFAFLGLMAVAFIVLTRIWGVDYSFGELWKGLSHDWVLHIEGLNVHVGFGGLLSLSLFILSGFIISLLVHRYILFKLFDIFRVAPGAQNTFSLIFHYVIIILSAILGLHAIKLGLVGNYILIGLSFGILFGLKDLVADFFAGLWILIERPIEIDNFIETGKLKGTVKKIAMRATTIRTARNFSVVVPNRELVSKPIINWGSGYYAVGFELKVTVGYESDADQVRSLILKIVSDHKMVLRIPGVSVRLEAFVENGMLFFCRAFISSRRVRDQWDIASEIRITLMREFKKANIVVPYPRRMLIHSIDEQAMTKKQAEDIAGQVIESLPDDDDTQS